MDGLFSTVSRHIKQPAVIEFLTHENETPTEIHRRLLAFCGEDAADKSTVHHWVRSSSDSGRNEDVNVQLWSGRHVTATHCEYAKD
jgi:hypothetical protein